MLSSLIWFAPPQAAFNNSLFEIIFDFDRFTKQLALECAVQTGDERDDHGLLKINFSCSFLTLKYFRRIFRVTEATKSKKHLEVWRTSIVLQKTLQNINLGKQLYIPQHKLYLIIYCIF